MDDLDNAEWIEETLLALIRHYGASRFQRKIPILLADSYGDLRRGPPADFLNAVVRDMADAARISVKGISVEVYRDENITEVLSNLGLPHSMEDADGTAGIFHGFTPDGAARIAVEESGMDDDIALAGTLAHELAHVFLLGNRPAADAVWPAEDEEPVTDLMAILLGFGVYICNSNERFRAYDDGRLTGWSASRRGYLTLEEACYAQAVVHALFAQESRTYFAHLTPNPRALLEEALPLVGDRMEQVLATNADPRSLREQSAPGPTELPRSKLALPSAVKNPKSVSRTNAAATDNREANPRPASRRRALQVHWPAFVCLAFVLLDTLPSRWVAAPAFWVTFGFKALAILCALYWYRSLTEDHGSRHGRRPSPPATALRLGVHGIMTILVVGVTAVANEFRDISNTQDQPWHLGMALATAVFDLALCSVAIGYYGFVSGRFRM